MKRIFKLGILTFIKTYFSNISYDFIILPLNIFNLCFIVRIIMGMLTAKFIYFYLSTVTSFKTAKDDFQDKEDQQRFQAHLTSA